MSIYNIENEVAITDPAASDLLVIYDASAKAAKSITLDQLLAFLGGGGTPVNVTAATLALTRADHAGRIVTLNRAGGIDVTLPAATGSGDTYEFFVGTTTTDAYTFAVTGDDTIAGNAFGQDGEGDPANGWTDTNATLVTLGGTSNATGGTIGDKIKFRDVAADLWSCEILMSQGGTEATPFSTP